jgi:acetyl-CoA acetyltransferase
MFVAGCGALVVTRAEPAADSPVKPAYVVGQSMGGVRTTHPPFVLWDDWAANAKHQANDLWKNSGLSPADVDSFTSYDGFAWFVYCWLEAMGFCGEGEAHQFVQDGRIARDGELPVNCAGGSLGVGRMHGTVQLIEAARQVQGVAGPYQVDGAEISVCAGGGAAISGSATFAFAKTPH